MIMFYSGTPGSGKSLHMAREIYLYLNSRHDRLVICNFQVNLDGLRYPERFVYLSNRELSTPNALYGVISGWYEKGHALKENNIIIFIDECQIIFNARRWNESGRNEWLEFFSQHRKYGCDIYLVAQFDGMIDKQIRTLIEYEVIHRKVSNFGLLGKLVRLFTFGDVFIAVEHWYSINEKTGQEIFRARKRYYSLYDTFNTFGNQFLDTGSVG